MRVAFIHSGYSRGLQSGIIRIETELVAELKRRGHVAEIMPWEEDPEGSLVAQQYLRIVRPAAFIYKQIRDYINHGKFDLVVFQGVGYPETRALPWLKRECKAKFLIIQHGWPLHNPASRFLVNSYMQTVGHILLNEADHVVVVSNFVLAHLAEYREPDRMALVPPGVDVTLFKPSRSRAALRKKWKIKKRYVLLGNGKLSSLKNYTTMIRALPLLPNTEFLLVGSGSHTRQDMYKELAQELGVENRVRFLGTMPNQKLPELYGLADVFVHPSKSEALPIVILEALACETPVVVADVGGIRDVVIDNFNGLLYRDPKDHEELASRVRELLVDPKRGKEFGHNGRELVKAKFNWKQVLPAFIHEFERTLTFKSQPTDESTGVFGAFA
jgi:glycosyltransferase involved in cell wall biosynthesis